MIIDCWQSDDSTVFFLSVANNYEPIGFVKTPSAVMHLSWSPESFVRRRLSLLHITALCKSVYYYYY